MAQLMPLPLTISCFSEIQIGFTFLVPACPGSPGQRVVKRVCVCVCVNTWNRYGLMMQIDWLCMSVSVCVCLFITIVSPAKVAQPIVMPFVGRLVCVLGMMS